MVGVCLDDEGDREKARALMAEAGNPFRSAFNGGFWSGTVAKAYGVHYIPRAFLLGPDGRVLGRETFLDAILEDAAQPGR